MTTIATTTNGTAKKIGSNVWDRMGGGGNSSQPLSTTTVATTMAHRLKIQQLQHPVPTSMILTAALQLLLDHPEYHFSTTAAITTNNTAGRSTATSAVGSPDTTTMSTDISVYLMDRAYLKNWFLWAQNQTVSPSEVERTKEALALAASLYNVKDRESSSSNCYTDPGPIDNTSLSMDEHPLVLDSNIHVVNLRTKWNSIPTLESSLESLSATSVALKDNKNSTNTNINGNMMGTSSYRVTSSRVDASNSTPSTFRKVHSTSAVPSPSLSTFSKSSSNEGPGVHSNKNLQTTAEHGNGSTSSSSKLCIAVPESFYETLRNVHGVVCDDYYTISYQPYLSGDHDDETGDRLILQHHIYHSQPPMPQQLNAPGTDHDIKNSNDDITYSVGNQVGLNYHHSLPTDSCNSTMNGGLSLTSPPRPIEFRRKIVRQLDYDYILQQRQRQLSSATTLMEKLLLEEQIQNNKIPIILAVEVHPVKLTYFIHSDTSRDGIASKESASLVAAAAKTTTTSTGTRPNSHTEQELQDGKHLIRNVQKYEVKGFVLVSSETAAVDALLALLRVAEPTKGSQSVRVWSQWNYDEDDSHNEKDSVSTATMTSNNAINNNMNNGGKRRSRPTKAGDGYELVNLEQLADRKYWKTHRSNLSNINSSSTKNLASQSPTTGGASAGAVINSPDSVTTVHAHSSSSSKDGRITMGEWVKLHHPALKQTSLLSSTLSPKYQQQHQQPKGLNLIVETRRTVRTTWPREALQLCNRLKPGDFVDAQDVAGKWYEAVVTCVTDDHITVHYAGWASRWDTKLPKKSYRHQQQHRKRRGAPSVGDVDVKKNDTSNGTNIIGSGGNNHTVDNNKKTPLRMGSNDSTIRIGTSGISLNRSASPCSETSSAVGIGATATPRMTTPDISASQSRIPPSTSTLASVSLRLQPPAPLWSHSGRWREQLQVGDIVEVRDSSSLAQRPKWYCGIVKKISINGDPIHDVSGGADLEEYSVLCGEDDNNDNGQDNSSVDGMINDLERITLNSTKMKEKQIKSSESVDSVINGITNSSVADDENGDDDDDEDDATTSTSATTKTAPLILLRRTQQILVEVEQERKYQQRMNPLLFSEDDPVLLDTAPGTTNNDNINNTQSKNELIPQPPYRRWVNLYGEEICEFGTHLNVETAGLTTAKSTAPVTLTYEYDSNRKPVEIMKQSHPMHGSGFMRESLRGDPPAPGSVGLHNLGNSCFLNSTVQCLNHIKPLTQYFLDDRYSKDLNKNNPLGSGGNVSVAYASLLKKIWAGNHSILVPRLLKQTVANFAPQFDNSYQHDSHEFCQFLMDGLHEDLNRVKKKPYVEELEGFGMDDSTAAIESWRKHLLRHDSIIVDHCQGMHRSHLTCPQCGRESIKFDVYSSISLPLAIEKHQKATINLEDCIEKFMEAEQLDERDAYYCPNCRKHVCALKLIALWTIPDILILHLKRFTFDTCMTSGSMLRSKIDSTVRFPIDGLDLTKQMLGPIDPDAKPIYNLFGVSEHTGPTANSGHYTATVRNSVNGQWYRCNDSHVGQTSGDAAVTGGAYLLFYQRAKGLSKWGGMARAMKERNINPYGGLEPPPTSSDAINNAALSYLPPPPPQVVVVVDPDGFTQVNKKNKKSQASVTTTTTTSSPQRINNNSSSNNNNASKQQT